MSCAASIADHDITHTAWWWGVWPSVLMLYCASLLEKVHDVGSIRCSAYSLIAGEDSRCNYATNATCVLVCDNKTTRIIILRRNSRVLCLTSSIEFHGQNSDLVQPNTIHAHHFVSNTVIHSRNRHHTKKECIWCFKLQHSLVSLSIGSFAWKH